MLTFEEKDNAIVCRFAGDMSANVCSQIESDLEKQVNAFIEDHDQTRIVFDLADVRYISSAFLRLCLLYAKKANSSNFSIINCSEEVMKVFQISGFIEIMRVSQAGQSA